MVRITRTGKRRTVLLVEDDRDVREVFREALRLEGLDVRTAPDGLTALWQIEQNPPDVLILDLELPRVTGLDILRDLNSRPNAGAMPVVVVTGTDWSVTSPVFATVRKPIAPDALVDVVTRALMQGGPSLV